MNGKQAAVRAWRLARAASCVALAIGITACGGGGGDGASHGASTGTPDAGAISLPAMPASQVGTTTGTTSVPSYAPVTSEAGTLLISEVATNHYSNDIAWLEVINTSNQTLQLSRYTLRSSHIDSASGVSTQAAMEFPLPDVTLAPGGHLVIASMTSDSLPDTPQMVYVKNGTARPFWNANGSVELVREDLHRTRSGARRYPDAH